MEPGSWFSTGDVTGNCYTNNSLSRSIFVVRGPSYAEITAEPDTGTVTSAHVAITAPGRTLWAWWCSSLR